MIADMFSWIEMLRGLVYRTAWLVDNHRPFNREAYVCKLMGSEICQQVRQLRHGDPRCAWAEPRLSRWSVPSAMPRIAEIFEGTNEIQRIIIARDLLRDVGVSIEP